MRFIINREEESFRVEGGENELKEALNKCYDFIRVSCALFEASGGWGKGIEKGKIKKDRQKNIITYEMEKEVTKKLFAPQIEDYKRKKRRKGKSKEEIREMVTERAKKTGEKQFFYAYSRDDNARESDVALVNVYITPEGEEEEQVIHAH